MESKSDDVHVDFDSGMQSRNNQKIESNDFRPATLTFSQPRNTSQQPHNSRLISSGYYDLLAEVESFQNELERDDNISTYSSSSS
jgi:hypothetical protein